MKLKLSIVPLLAMILIGCAGLGLEPATSFEERLAYAVSQNAALRTAAANSLKAGDITVDDAKTVLKLTDNAREALDAARLAAGAGDLSTAEARLTLGVTVLQQLQVYLRERGKK